MIPLPPADRRLPGLASLFDPAAMMPLLAEALTTADGPDLVGYRPRYIRYKPGTSCLVQVDLAFRDGDGEERIVGAHLKCFVDDRARCRAGHTRLRRQAERARSADPALPWRRVAFVPRVNALLQVFPVDYDLKSLARVTDPDWAGKHIGKVLGDHSIAVSGQPEVIRYKPERKALVRYDLSHGPHDRLYGKLHADDRGAALAGWTSSLVEAGVTTPPVVLSRPERRFVAHAEAVGLPLAALRGTAGYAGWMPSLVASLDHLQRVDVPGLAAHRLADELAALAETVSLLAVIVPHLASRLDRVLQELARQLTGVDDVLQTAHGDFYDDQAIVSGDGLALIDLDELRLAHPAIDAGNMLAHLASGHARGENVAGARGTFRDEVQARHPEWATTLDPFEAAGLLRLAPGPFRRLEPDWPDGVERILALAEACLGRKRVSHPVGRTALVDDPLLPHLPQVLDPVTVAVHLAAATGRRHPVETAELVRHKPGRRAIVRYALAGGAVLYGKTFASKRGPKVHHIARQLTDAHAFGRHVALPAPVAWVPECNLLVQRAVAGEPVEGALRAGDTGVACRIAEALHRLHASGLDLGRTHDLAKELEPLAMRTEGVATACPDLGGAAHVLHQRLLDLAGTPFRWRGCPIHRDCYHDQVLLDGGRLAVLDLDDASMSEPAVDIANFAAHLRLLGYQQPGDASALIRVESAFRERAAELDPDLDETLLTYLVAATMLRLAGIHVTRANGPAVARHLLGAASRELDRIPATGSSPMVEHPVTGR